MMKKLYRMVALALAAAALCFSLTGCGISDFFKNKDNKTQERVSLGGFDNDARSGDACSGSFRNTGGNEGAGQGRDIL